MLKFTLFNEHIHGYLQIYTLTEYQLDLIFIDIKNLKVHAKFKPCTEDESRL